MRIVAISARFALAVACTAALDGGNARIALFQERTIFHSGLRGMHTVALTFDDGPNPNTIGVLNVLKASATAALMPASAAAAALK